MHFLPSPDGGFGRELQLPTCYTGPKGCSEGTQRICAKWDGPCRWRCQADTWCGAGEWSLSLALHCWPLYPSSLPSSLIGMGGQLGHWRQPPTPDLLDGCACPREECPKPGGCSTLVGLSLNLNHTVQPHDAQPCRIISWDWGRVESQAVPEETSCEPTQGWCSDVCLHQGWCVPWVPLRILCGWDHGADGPCSSSIPTHILLICCVYTPARPFISTRWKGGHTTKWSNFAQHRNIDEPEAYQHIIKTQMISASSLTWRGKMVTSLCIVQP